MLNYHELTMNEPRDSPQRRKQFLVISSIMVVMTLYAGLTAGVLETVTIDEGTFPGGEFVYKSMVKDYAASTGTLRTVASDLGIGEGGSSIIEWGDEDNSRDLLYSILLDDERLVPGGMTRFASGALLSSGGGESQKQIKKQLLEVNKDITKEGGTHSKDIKYEVGKLPKVDAAVTQHPFTAGVWSAILQSYKIIPEFKKYAEERGETNPVVIATCSADQRMCTYYMPLAKRDKFFMGKPITTEYAKQFDDYSTLQKWGIGIESEDGLSVGGINLHNVFKGVKKSVGLGGSSKKTSDEL